MALWAYPALAGDRAQIDFIGFSPDARYFAFEEFGIQDGSGFAYSSIYVLDLTTDSWLEGTPIRKRAEDEAKTLLSVRLEASSQALRLIAEKEIFVSAEIVALIGDGAPGMDGKTLDFGRPGYAAGAVLDERRLAISTFAAETAEDCESYFGAAPLGYELTLSHPDETMVLHRDMGPLPASRGCPTDYRLYGVALPALAGEPDRGAVIVSVYPGGFEGPDRRFLAVPFGF